MLSQNREMAELSGKLLRSILEKQTKKLEEMFRGLYEMTDGEAKAKKMGGGCCTYCGSAWLQGCKNVRTRSWAYRRNSG